MMMSELKVLFDKRAAALATVAATEAKLSELSRANIAAGGLTRPQIGALSEVREALRHGNSGALADAYQHVRVLADAEAEAHAAAEEPAGAS
jgi:hypothetical protein